MRFKQAKAFFDGLRIEKQIEYFSIFGGIPAYLNQVNYTKDLFENVKDKWLKKDSFLYNDPEFVLKEELRKPRVYFSILKAISFGKIRDTLFMIWRMYLNCRSISNRCHGEDCKNNARAYHDNIRGCQKRELGDRRVLSSER